MTKKSYEKPTTADRLLTVRDVAQRLQFSEREVRRWIATGKLATRRFGRSVRIAEEDLADLIRRSRK